MLILESLNTTICVSSTNQQRPKPNYTKPKARNSSDAREGWWISSYTQIFSPTMELIWKLCYCEAILVNKINFSGEPFKKNMHYYPFMVFASQYQVRQKPEFGFCSTVALWREMTIWRNNFLQGNLFFPNWGTCMVFLHSHRAEELSSPLSCGEELSWVFPWVILTLILHTNSLLSLLYSKVVSVDHLGIHLSILQAFFKYIMCFFVCLCKLIFLLAILVIHNTSSCVLLTYNQIYLLSHLSHFPQF